MLIKKSEKIKNKIKITLNFKKLLEFGRDNKEPDKQPEIQTFKRLTVPESNKKSWEMFEPIEKHFEQQLLRLEEQG